MIQSLLYKEIETAVLDGAETFYVGMARGTDLWAADMILLFRRLYPTIRLCCVLPFAGRVQQANPAERYHLQSLLDVADEVITLSDQYYNGCYRARNQYMIAHSQRLIAVLTDKHSGTGQTVRMAERAGLDVRTISLEQALHQKTPAHEFFRFDSD